MYRASLVWPNGVWSRETSTEPPKVDALLETYKDAAKEIRQADYNNVQSIWLCLQPVARIGKKSLFGSMNTNM